MLGVFGHSFKSTTNIIRQHTVIAVGGFYNPLARVSVSPNEPGAVISAEAVPQPKVANLICVVIKCSARSATAQLDERHLIGVIFGEQYYNIDPKSTHNYGKHGIVFHHIDHNSRIIF